MLLILGIILCSFFIFKISLFLTNRISSEIDTFVENEYFTCGFISRDFLSTADRSLIERFCKLFFLSHGYREITTMDIYIPGAKVYIANKNDLTHLIFSFKITKDETPISRTQLAEIVGILHERNIFNGVILCDYEPSTMKKVINLDAFNITPFTPLELTEFYWNNNNYLKERIYD